MHTKYIPLTSSFIAFSTAILSPVDATERRITFFYYVFVLSQIIFIAIFLQIRNYFSKSDSLLLTLATGFGALAGFAQAISFLRWPFLAPYLSSLISKPETSMSQTVSAST
ncbi:MAG: hypothetical protein OEM38_09575 [Gammaproteobacteria bacterium]|nr:hypothetical protein [Gammaproteobacteria bacterium]